MASDFYSSGYEIKPMLIRLFVSPQFVDPSNYFKRYSWPAEFVARSIKEMGWSGFSVNDALNPMITMGQQLFEPPDVVGWDLGQSWFTSGAMLGRMNFAAQLATNQKFELRNAARGSVKSPEGLVSWALDRLTDAVVRRRIRTTRWSTTRAPAAPGPVPTRSWRPRPPAWRT